MRNVSLARRLFLNILLALTFAFTSNAVLAESTIDPENLPPWLSPELLVHIVAMDLDDSQKEVFRKALTECLTGMQSIVQREIRKGGVDIPRRIKRGINREYSMLDDRMKATLAEPQLGSWANYLEGLKATMAERAG
ncbi:MAG: hypothetical protein HON77_03810 [Gammaproteobacteria bacterium]|jgi:hypothetical protein|nr:hypothetical protein [Gammaproteobacteria bacterium]MBT5724455.1 hypothetical protein [Gammaproteobacteria bacterium]MBT6583409.1 hypothetical protein [Gammaproteobacteria bacterium]MBT6890628.1 hypothetical protein [Gammaproteobacteria bacterium]MBT7877498.1 hypothetical protein [Gammaproteobacteria bacterium]